MTSENGRFAFQLKKSTKIILQNFYQGSGSLNPMLHIVPNKSEKIFFSAL
jgi:hypothetical protein